MTSIPQLWVITGLMAAGKSSVAQALAERLPRSVHVRGDVFRRMIIRGREEMAPDPSSEAVVQLSLRYRLACRVVSEYLDAGFSVVYQDTMLGAHLQDVATMLAPYWPRIVMLNPSLEVVARRDRQRGKTAYSGVWTPESLATALQETPRLGLWLDTSLLTIEETVDRILTHRDR